MHIAVCDDNVADRKQLERLLKRESDKRKDDTGVLYTSSYGNSGVLAKNPMPYDLFFIDMTEGEPDGLTFALELIQAGVTAPIVLCSSKIDYSALMRSKNICFSNILHLNKPIITAELSATIDKALAIYSQKIPTIELRSETETYYVTEDDIVYAITSGNYVHVFLKDGRMVELLTDMYNFFDQICMFTHMVMCSDHAMCNVVYVDSCHPFKVILKDGTVLKSTPFSLRHFKTAMEMYRSELSR